MFALVLNEGECEIETEALVERIQKILEDKKGQDIVVLDVRERSIVTDWIVVASGMSKPHVKALYEDVLVRLKQEGVQCYRHNGEVEGGWLVLDYFHVVLHVFIPEVRDFYQIEDLWQQDVDTVASTIAVSPQSELADLDMAEGVDTTEPPKGRQAKAPSKRKTSSPRPSAKSMFTEVAKRARKASGTKSPPRPRRKKDADS